MRCCLFVVDWVEEFRGEGERRLSGVHGGLLLLGGQLGGAWGWRAARVLQRVAAR
jgi:hypothetical protein